MRKNFSRIARMALASACIAAIAACGGGDGDGGSDGKTVVQQQPPVVPPPPDAVDNQLSGSVGDGPVVNGRIRIYDDRGNVAADLLSDATASYKGMVRVPNIRYPLVIEATGGTDLVTGGAPDFRMASVAMRPAPRTVGNINPHTTLIVETALRLGPGPTDNALASARTTVLQQLNFGLDRRLVGDPLTSPIVPANVAVMVKSSEAFGEMIRRTRDALIGTGVATGDAVVEALAADLADGVADGRGTAGANPRVAAVSHLVAAQVLLEALQNELRVGGVAATQAMDDAIRQIEPRATVFTDGVGSPAAMLAQAVIALDAAFAFAGDPLIDSAAAVVRELPAGVLPQDVRGRLPEGIRAALQAAIDDAALAGDAGLELVNHSVRKAEASTPGVAHVSFDAASYSVVEGQQLQVTIRRDTSSGAATVTWRTRAGTARGGEDFRGHSGKTISFADGESAKTVTVDTLADDVEEDDEVFRLELNDATGAELGSPSSVEVTLVNAAATGHYPPELLSAVADGGSYILTWRHPQHPPGGGYDVIVDGSRGGAARWTMATTMTVGPLDATVPHCFAVDALYPEDQTARRSNELCVDPGGPPTGDGTATLSWTPPTERTDGTALDNLAGYIVYYGIDETRLDQVVVIDNPGLTRFVVENLGQATWYFGIKAYDADGRRSALSTLGSKTFP